MSFNCILVIIDLLWEIIAEDKIDDNDNLKLRKIIKEKYEIIKV